MRAPPPNTRPLHRRAQLALTIVFLGLIVAVPLSQTALELVRGQRVQFTSVFRDAPTSANLRRYEAALKEKSWVQQTFRPLMHRLMFQAFGDAGAKAVRGRDGWLFYRPDVRFLIEGSRPDTGDAASRWVQPAAPVAQWESVAGAIRRFHDQIEQRGIRLLVVPVPGKPSVHPEQLTARADARAARFASPTGQLIAELERRGVPTVDLLSVFERARSNTPSEKLYLAHDTHWTPQGARLAAEAVAARLRDLGWAPPATTAFTLRKTAVDRWGDILEMMRIPGLRDMVAPQRIECEQVLDPALGPLAPGPSERPGTYRHPIHQSPLLVLGDSFSRIYQLPEPRSLGTAPVGTESPDPENGGRRSSKRLLPGSAGFLSHLAHALQAPVDAIVSDGGASTDVRRKLSTNPEILEGKRVVIWQFVERDIALGRAGWADVPLPVELGK
ncbi:MAG TPA: hypothetical protein PK640_06710 [Verrucomicrobiota bacterium]|nr:hypothetical protein [Verrucomicrobiota bacterium]